MKKSGIQHGVDSDLDFETELSALHGWDNMDSIDGILTSMSEQEPSGG